MKRFLIILIIFLAIFFSLVAAKNVLVKQILESSLEKELGVNINIKDLDVSFLGGNLRIKGLTIDNPEGFEKREFAYVPLINIVCNPFEYLKNRTLHLFFLDLNIERINLIKNEDGQVNLKKLVILTKKEPAKSDKSSPFLIEVFRLTLCDVYFIEYLPHHKPRLKRYNLDIKDIAFGNLNSFEDVVKLVVLKAIAQTDIGKLIHLSIEPLLQDTKDIVLVSGKAVKDLLKGIFGLPFLLKGDK